MLTVLFQYCCLLCACGGATSNPVKYMKAIAANEDLQKTVRIAEMEYRFTVVPPEIMVLNETYDKETSKMDVDAFRERIEELKDFIYVRIRQAVPGNTVSMLKYKCEDMEEYNRRVMYYQYYAKEDLYLYCDGKEQKPLSYVFEDNMDISPYNDMVAVFRRCGNDGDIQIRFDDLAFGNNFIKVFYSKEDLKNISGFKMN